MTVVRIFLLEFPVGMSVRRVNALLSEQPPADATADELAAVKLWRQHAWTGNYHPDLNYVLAATYHSDEQLDAEVCEAAFRTFNIGHEAPLDEADRALATTYRENGHRSLSVGDLVVLDGGEVLAHPASEVVIPKVKAYICGRVGWDLIGDFDLTKHTVPA